MGTVIQTSEGMKPSTLSKQQQELERHRDLIGLEVEASLNNGGWWREPSSMVVKARMFQKWMDALDQYQIGEIIKAFNSHTRQNPNKKPNEGHIIALIEQKRSGVSPKVDMAEFWASAIKSGGFVSNSCFTPNLTAEMLERGLVTKDQLKKRRLQF